MACRIFARCAQYQHQIALIGKNDLGLQLPRVEGLLEHRVVDLEFPRQRSQTRLVHASIAGVGFNQVSHLGTAAHAPQAGAIRGFAQDID
ncbi:MAG: hypothetical protein ACREYF_01170 [Gammaproteobacteria bacterium]